MIQDAILTCTKKLTKVSLIYRMALKSKKWGKEKLESKNEYAEKYW